MKTIVILLVVAVIVLAVSVVLGWITERLARRYSELSHFVHNCAGDALAVVGFKRYLRTPLSPETGNRFRIVPETVVLVRQQWHEGNLRHAFPGISCSHFDDKKDLFVPRVSEKFFTFAEQDRMFVTIDDVEGFIAQTKRDNRKGDFRFWLHDFAPRVSDVLGWINSLTIVACVILAILYGLGALIANSERIGKESVTIYVTTPEKGLVTITTTRNDRHEFLLDNSDDYDEFTLYSGKVTGMLGVGGGLAQVCIERSNKAVDCGTADSSLGIKEGDSIYFRRVGLLQYGDREQAMRSTNRGHVAIVVTAAEANQLMATGKFKIEQ